MKKNQNNISILDKLKKALLEGIEITIGVLTYELPLKANLTCRIMQIDEKKNLVEIYIIQGTDYVECILDISWIKFLYMKFQSEFKFI